MPELPEVETTCSGIRPHLENQSILRVEVRESRLRWPVSSEIEFLSSTLVQSVTRRAKYIFIQCEKGTIICHLGMSGSLRLSNSEAELRKHDHVIFHLENGQEMRFHDPRRFGCLLWSNDPSNHQLIRHLGPEPLEDTFSSAYLYERSRTSKSDIKQFIMNNKIVVGIGNIYACESLFLSGISPKSVSQKVSKKRLEKLHSQIQLTLGKAIQQGGTTLRDFVNQDGEPGYFQQELFVYNREGLPCKICGSLIKRIVQGQRSTFYCGKCQK